MDRPLRVACVDDDPHLRSLVEHALKASSYEVALYASGAEALAKLAAFRPDVLLLDVIMPEMDGRETLRQLRAGNGEPAPLIAFMTGMTRAADRAACTDQGARLISKPINPLQLGDQIWALWQEQQRAA